MYYAIFGGEPSTIKVLGYSIDVIPGWWQVAGVPAAMIFLFAIMIRMGRCFENRARRPSSPHPDAQ